MPNDSNWGHLWWNRPPRNVHELITQVGLHGAVLTLALAGMRLTWPVVLIAAGLPMSVRLFLGARYLRSNPDVVAANASERAADIRDFDQGFGGQADR
ncbi:MAG: hypothetical protein JWN31_37 [Frankiales bacterium]|nr:hypothetical protein [Frankiales bacterium]